jgi:hypothetical protein
LPNSSDKNRDKPSLDTQPEKSRFEKSVIDSTAPEISSRPEDWDGFSDPFWNLGQVLIWAATRNPKYVDNSSDASGALGKHTGSSDIYGRVAAGDQIKKNLTPQQQRDVITQVKQSCLNGTLNASAQNESLSPEKWRDLEIRVVDGVPTVVSRKYPDVPGPGAHITPDLRFRRQEVLRCFPSLNDSVYTKIPEVEPRQLSARLAHQALKQMYADGRIPAHISDQTLAERASRFIRKTVSRDDVRRALGTKK